MILNHDFKSNDFKSFPTLSVLSLPLHVMASVGVCFDGKKRLHFVKENKIDFIIIIIMEKTEAGLRGLCIREIDVKSQILVTEYYSKLLFPMPWRSA